MQATIMVVDDQPIVLNVLKQILTHGEYIVLTAQSATEALDLLEKNRVNVIISDERMPGMAGSELLARVKDRYPEVVRIILTGHASLDAALKAINQSEVFRFLTKPCNSQKLLATIAEALEHSHATLREHKLSLMETLEKKAPGITRVKRDSDGAIIIEDN